MWQSGQSGNPNGRPVGSRTVLSQAFLKDLAQVWQGHGRETMIKTTTDQPAVLFRNVCSIATWRRSANDSALITAVVRQAIPDTASAAATIGNRELLFGRLDQPGATRSRASGCICSSLIP
jgi:hypothetical protein